MSESHSPVELLKSSASSATRVMRERKAVAACLGDPETSERLRQVTRPNSISRTLRKAGVALILAPDPITAVPGVVMLGASFAMRGREPLTPASVVEETRKLLSELDSFF